MQSPFPLGRLPPEVQARIMQKMMFRVGTGSPEVAADFIMDDSTRPGLRLAYAGGKMGFDDRRGDFGALFGRFLERLPRMLEILRSHKRAVAANTLEDLTKEIWPLLIDRRASPVRAQALWDIFRRMKEAVNPLPMNDDGFEHYFGLIGTLQNIVRLTRDIGGVGDQLDRAQQIWPNWYPHPGPGRQQW